MDTPAFLPIPKALCKRIIGHAKALASARTEADAVKALFLIHCELKDAEAMLPKPEPAQQTVTAGKI